MRLDFHALGNDRHKKSAASLTRMTRMTRNFEINTALMPRIAGLRFGCHQVR